QFDDKDFIEAAIEVEQIENEVERIDDGGVTIRSLHKLQSHIREEVWKEETEKQVQSMLE
ncbi:2221_t:CDS:2, partial [Dentiscutata heterogama]